MTLMDESGEIRATGFNATVDDFYDRIQEGKVYMISKAKVNLAKKKFSNVQNDFELTLERSTEIEEVRDKHLVCKLVLKERSAMMRRMFLPLNSTSLPSRNCKTS